MFAFYKNLLCRLPSSYLRHDVNTVKCKRAQNSWLLKHISVKIVAADWPKNNFGSSKWIGLNDYGECSGSMIMISIFTSTSSRWILTSVIIISPSTNNCYQRVPWTLTEFHIWLQMWKFHMWNLMWNWNTSHVHRNRNDKLN
jgi:hypothetical protein